MSTKTEALSSKDQPATKNIHEGSAIMTYPADQESTVFYNPVQVQNRDLSILMITLYGERRAALQAVTNFRQSLKKEQTQKSEQGANEDKKSGDTKEKGNSKDAALSLKEKVDEFEAKLNPSQAVLDMSKLDSANGLCILDALAASGLRSIRYWKEIPGVHHVTINDLDEAAIERAQANISANGLSDVHLSGATTTHAGRRPSGIKTRIGDATSEMYNSRPLKKLRPGMLPNPEDPSWDVIDLDPYGSTAPFLDAAIQAAVNGGLLCVTSTDMRVLGGSQQADVCVARYGAMSFKSSPYLHEMALRILLQSAAVTAAKYGRSIRPILSVGMDFYVRIFFTVHDNGAEANELSLNLGYIYQSTQCPSFSISPMGRLGGKNNKHYQAGRPPPLECFETEGSLKVAGPIWLGPLHDKDVLRTALDRLSSKGAKSSTPDALEKLATKDRLRGLLMSCRDELTDVPLYYRSTDLARTLGISQMPMKDMQYALANAGYRVSSYHKEPGAIKTDAPNNVIWDIYKTFYRIQQEKNPTVVKPPKEGSPAEKILSKAIGTKVDFSRPSGKAMPSNLADKAKEQVARFPLNPEANWGPKKAATGHKRKAEDDLSNTGSEKK